MSRMREQLGRRLRGSFAGSPRRSLSAPLLALLGVALAAGPAPAEQPPLSFPGGTPSKRVLEAQRKAEELYEQGEHRRALFIFEKDLAPIGDKYAQYMVGYMHLHGESVRADPVTAYAWYRLAAERGDPALEGARRELRALLTDEEARRSYEIFVELRDEIGDRALVARLLEQDLNELRQRTASRAGSSARRVEVLLIDGTKVPGDKYYAALEERIEKRRAYLRGYVEMGEVEMIADELD